MSRTRQWLVPAALVLGAPLAATAACTSGHSSSQTSTTTPGDARSSPFCKSLVKMAAIKDPTKNVQANDDLLAQAGSQAPADLKADFQVLADLLHASAHPEQTTTSLDAARLSQLSRSVTAVSNYAVAHCGIKLPTGP